MDNQSPRHARSAHKRHRIERAEVIGMLSIAVSVLGIVLTALFGLGIIGPWAGHTVVPGPGTTVPRSR